MVSHSLKKMHPSYKNQCEAHSAMPTVKAGEENLTAGNGSWFDSLSQLPLPIQHSLLHPLYPFCFDKFHLEARISQPALPGPKYLNSLLKAASTQLGAAGLSQQPCLCWQPRGPHSVHITWCTFSHTGLTLGGQTNALILPKYLVHYTCKTLPSF